MNERFGRLRLLLPFGVILVIYAVSILLVNPKGEFPLNDDWSYTRSAFRLGVDNRLAVDEFSAPNLVGQSLYGALLVKIFGSSFLALRLSTLVLSCAVVCMLWKILRLLGAGTGIGWVAVLSWLFNPVQFCLSFTFMTEIPFLFLICAATLAYAHYLATQKLRHLTACGAALGYAFLIRQTSVLFIAGMGLSLVLERTALLEKLRRLAVWGLSTASFIVAYYLLAPNRGSATPAAQRKFELLRHLTIEQVVGNIFGSAFYLSFFLLPLLAWLVPLLFRQMAASRRVQWGVVLAGWTVVSAAGIYWFHSRYSGGPYLPARAFHSRMPFLLNILFDTGLGPVTLDPTYYGPPPTPTYPRIWMGVTFLVAAGLVVLGVLCTWGGSRLRPIAQQSKRSLMVLYCAASLIAAVLFETVFSHLQEGGLFDRHILTAAFPLTLLVSLLSRSDSDQPEPDPARKTAPAGRLMFVIGAGLMLAVLGWFCITATHDYMAWNRLRWDLCNELLAQNVNPLTVSGGFEFNGWENYDKFRARGHIEKIYFWWYDTEDYIIAMQPQEAYRIQKRLDYYSWLHRKNLSVYVLHKE